MSLCTSSPAHRSYTIASRPPQRLRRRGNPRVEVSKSCSPTLTRWRLHSAVLAGSPGPSYVRARGTNALADFRADADLSRLHAFVLRGRPRPVTSYVNAGRAPERLDRAGALAFPTRRLLRGNRIARLPARRTDVRQRRVVPEQPRMRGGRLLLPHGNAAERRRYRDSLKGVRDPSRRLMTRPRFSRHRLHYQVT